MKSKKNLKLQADDYASKAVYTISGAILILAVVLCVLEYRSIGVQKIHLQSNLMSIQDEVILEIDVKPTAASTTEEDESLDWLDEQI